MRVYVFHRHKYDFAYILCYVCIRSIDGIYVKNDAADEYFHGGNPVKNICRYRIDVNVSITNRYLPHHGNADIFKKHTQPFCIKVCTGEK